MTPRNQRIRLFQVLPALLLAVWYLFAVTGIDVHRDAEHGRTYVVSGLSGCDCERIHPEHHCHDSATEGECLEGEECCSDDFEAVLALGETEEAGLDLSVPVSAFPVPELFAQAVPTQGSFSMVRCEGPPPLEPAAAFIELCVLRI